MMGSHWNALGKSAELGAELPRTTIPTAYRFTKMSSVMHCTLCPESDPVQDFFSGPWRKTQKAPLWKTDDTSHQMSLTFCMTGKGLYHPTVEVTQACSGLTRDIATLFWALEWACKGTCARVCTGACLLDVHRGVPLKDKLGLWALHWSAWLVSDLFECKGEKEDMPPVFQPWPKFARYPLRVWEQEQLVCASVTRLLGRDSSLCQSWCLQVVSFSTLLSKSWFILGYILWS